MQTTGFKAPTIVAGAKALYEHFYKAYNGLRQAIVLPPIPTPPGGNTRGWPLNLPGMDNLLSQLPANRIQGMKNALGEWAKNVDVSTEASVGFSYSINLSKLWREGNSLDKLLVTGSMLGTFASRTAGAYLTSYLGQKIAERFGGVTAENLARVRTYTAIVTTAATAGWFGLVAGMGAHRGFLESFDFSAYFLTAPRPWPYKGIIPFLKPIGPAQDGQVVPADELRIGRVRAHNVLSYNYPIWRPDRSNDEL